MRSHYHLIQAVINEPWAIDASSIDSYMPIISGLFDNNRAFEKGDPVLPADAAGYGIAAKRSGGSDKQTQERKNIRVITMSGPMTKYSQYCGPAGMLDMARWIEEADHDPEVDAILLRIDSPGGMVAGTETLATAIREAEKPIVAYIDDLAASAAYWVASETQEIIANNTTAIVGSVGVMLSFMDIQPYLEKLGVKFHTITAPQSVNKTKLFEQLKAGNYKEYQEKVLRPLAQKFIDQVKANRPNATDEHFKGDTWFASELVGTLVDQIGNFQTALNRAATLAHEQQTQASIHSINNHSMKKTDLIRLATAAGVPQLETDDGTITLTAEMAEAVARTLEAHETAQADLQQQIDNHDTAQARVAELETELETANARIAELEQEAGADTAIIENETDGDSVTQHTDGFWDRFRALDEEFSNN